MKLNSSSSSSINFWNVAAAAAAAQSPPANYAHNPESVFTANLSIRPPLIAQRSTNCDYDRDYDHDQDDYDGKPEIRIKPSKSNSSSHSSSSSSTRSANYEKRLWSAMAGSAHPYQTQLLRNNMKMDQQYGRDQSHIVFALQRDSTALAANHIISANHDHNHAIRNANYDVNDGNCNQKTKKMKNSAVKKRPPQRGLGVAQLEKLRRMDPTTPATINHNNHNNTNLTIQKRLDNPNHHHRPRINPIAPCLNYEELKCSTNQMPLYSDSAADPALTNNYARANQSASIRLNGEEGHRLISQCLIHHDDDRLRQKQIVNRNNPSCLSNLMIANPAVDQGLISTSNRQYDPPRDRVMGHNACCQDHQSGTNSCRCSSTINLGQKIKDGHQRSVSTIDHNTVSSEQIISKQCSSNYSSATEPEEDSLLNLSLCLSREHKHESSCRKQIMNQLTGQPIAHYQHKVIGLPEIKLPQESTYSEDFPCHRQGAIIGGAHKYKCDKLDLTLRLWPGY